MFSASVRCLSTSPATAGRDRSRDFCAGQIGFQAGAGNERKLQGPDLLDLFPASVVSKLVDATSIRALQCGCPTGIQRRRNKGGGEGPGSVFAISDLHSSYGANGLFIKDLRPESGDDWLIVAGDVSETFSDI